MSTTGASEVKLWLSFGNVTKLALSIPLYKCSTFAVHPLKWLQFLGFAIYGCVGHLSTSEAGLPINDYTADIEPRSYYFLSEGKACLVDADVMDDRTSDASDLTIRRHDFRAQLIVRDGTCVMSGSRVLECTACHIIPHSKGSNYILNAVNHRGGTDVSGGDIDDIDDIRNGLLLNVILHGYFGTCDLAFLKTPNFALTVDDIPYQPPKDPNQESPDSRLTLHHFADPSQLGDWVPLMGPHNSDARQPHDTSQWPPAIIVDLSYAAAAVKAWSPNLFIDYVRDQSRDAYYGKSGDQYDSNSMDGSGPSSVNVRDETPVQSGSGHYNLRSRNKPSTIPPKGRHIADMMDVVSALWMQTSRVNKIKLEDAQPEASSLTRNEGVKAWLQSLEGSTTI